MGQYSKLGGLGTSLPTIPTLPSKDAAIQQITSKLSGLKTAGTTAASTIANSIQASLAALGSTASKAGGAVTSRYDASYDQAEALIAGFESEYCSPAEFSAGEKVPATFTGPAFALTFESGSCFFNDTALIYEGVKEIACVEPSISYAKSPAVFTSKYKSAPSFVGKSCSIEKEFGESIERVLFVFDGTTVPDVNELTAKIQAEVGQMMTGLPTFGPTQYTEQIQSMIGSLPSFATVAAPVAEFP